MAQPRCAVEKELATDEAESPVVRHNNFFSDRPLGGCHGSQVCRHKGHGQQLGRLALGRFATTIILGRGGDVGMAGELTGTHRSPELGDADAAGRDTSDVHTSPT